MTSPMSDRSSQSTAMRTNFDVSRIALRSTIALSAPQNPYIGVEQLSREATLLGHEYEDENDDDGHGCGAAVRDR
jgi:hypothetical protein